MTYPPDTPPAKPPRFALDVYDRRSLALRGQCDEARTLHLMGLHDVLADRLPALADRLAEFFRQTALSLETHRAPGGNASPAALPQALRDDLARCREDARLWATVSQNAAPPRRADALSPASDTPDPGELAGRCLALWRAGHRHIVSSLPPSLHNDIAADRRRWIKGGVALAAAVLCACLLVVGLPVLDRAWQTCKRDNLKVELALGDAPWPHVRLEGFLGPERDGDRRWRWGVGPRAEITLELDSPRMVSLHYVLSNPLPDQAVTVTVNDRAVASHTAIPAIVGLAPSVRGDVRFQGAAGLNRVAFSFAKTNDFTFVQETTPYSAAFLQLTLATGFRASGPASDAAP